MRSLTAGAPVEYRGIPIGEVSDISAQIDLKTFQFSVPVTIKLDPRRLGVKVLDLGPGVDLETMRRKLIDTMIAHGVRTNCELGTCLQAPPTSRSTFSRAHHLQRSIGRKTRYNSRPLRTVRGHRGYRREYYRET